MRHRAMSAANLMAVTLLAVTGCNQPDRPALAWGTPAAEPEDGRGAPAAEPKTRRVWTGDYGPQPAAVSPDGRFVTTQDNTNWQERALVVMDLASGETHAIARLAEDRAYAYGAAFSRDGRHLAYVWLRTDEWTSDVRIVDFAGAATGAPTFSEPRVVSDNPVRHARDIWDWSPDGRWLVGKSYGPANSIALELFSTAGETTLTLKSFDWREPLRATFSPDGRFVAYDLPSESDPRVRSIFVVSLDGRRERLVVGGGAMNRLFGWDPDDGILYVSQQGGAPALWRQPMTDGRPAGDPVLLRDDLWAAYPIGLAGRLLYYGVRAERPRLHQAGLDLEAARLTTAPQRVHDALDGFEVGHAWSGDGQHLAVLYADGNQLGRRLVVRAADGREVSELRIDVEGMNVFPQWPPDGSALLLYARDGRGRLGFHSVDLVTGAQRLLIPEEWTGSFVWSLDGRTLYYHDPSGNDEVARTVAALVEGTQDLLAAAAPGPVSPDGEHVATLGRTDDATVFAVRVVPVGGGPERELFRLGLPWRIRVVEWTPDGGHVMVSARLNEPPWENRTWLVPVGGGEARRLEGLSPKGRDPRLHPGGRRVAFMVDVNRNEIWALAPAAGTAAVTPTRSLP